MLHRPMMRLDLSKAMASLFFTGLFNFKSHPATSKTTYVHKVHTDARKLGSSRDFASFESFKFGFHDQS